MKFPELFSYEKNPHIILRFWQFIVLTELTAIRLIAGATDVTERTFSLAALFPKADCIRPYASSSFYACSVGAIHR